MMIRRHARQFVGKSLAGKSIASIDLSMSIVLKVVDYAVRMTLTIHLVLLAKPTTAHGLRLTHLAQMNTVRNTEVTI